MDVMQGIYDDFNGNRILQPTDLYVRILPQDTVQMQWLWRESNLELFDYPLDLDIPEGGEYVDPTIPEGEQGWLYTTVKPDYVFA